jgi:hypothetical protein
VYRFPQAGPLMITGLAPVRWLGSAFRRWPSAGHYAKFTVGRLAADEARVEGTLLAL